MKKLTREQIHNKDFENMIMNQIHHSDDEETIFLLKEELDTFKLINKVYVELSIFSKHMISKYFVVQMNSDEPDDLKTFLDRELQIIREVSGGRYLKRFVESINYMKQKYIIEYNKSTEEYFILMNKKFNYKKFKRQFIFKYYLDVILRLPMNIFYYCRCELNKIN